MPKIFISYKRQDRDTVYPIVDEIKQKTDIDCWIDIDGIESGDQFQNVIINAIDNAEIVIFMLSKNFIAPYVNEKTGEVVPKKQTFPEKEVMYALRHNKRLIPISIDGTTIFDCSWLEFNCSGLNYVDWNDSDQKNTLFSTLSKWSKTGTYDSEASPVRSDNKEMLSYFSQAYKNFKRYWIYICAALLSLAFVLFAIYWGQSSNTIYVNIKGLPEDSLVDFPQFIKDVETAGIDKITYILNDLLEPNESNAILSNLEGSSLSEISVCIGECSFPKLRSIFGKEDIYVDIDAKRDAEQYIANISITDWRGKQYEKTVHSDNVSQCITKVSAFMSLPYSPLLSVLYDYETPKEGDEYILRKLWKENLYDNEERESIMKQTIEAKTANSNLCFLVLAMHYEYLDKLIGNYSQLACENYEHFSKAFQIAGKSREHIEDRIKYLKEEDKPAANITLPEKLMAEGVLPDNPEVKQLVLVVNQKNKWVNGRKYPKGTLYTFEKQGDHWEEKFAPYEVNLSVNGITPSEKKKEGDMSIPAGFYTLSQAFGYERDIDTKLDFVTLNYDHVWICDSTDDLYNQMVEDKDNKYKRNPNELLKRSDHLYKYVIVIGYNINPTIKGKGSAIFIHVERRENSATAGCIAISEEAIKKLLEWLDPAMHPHIYISSKPQLRA